MKNSNKVKVKHLLSPVTCYFQVFTITRKSAIKSYESVQMDEEPKSEQEKETLIESTLRMAHDQVTERSNVKISATENLIGKTLKERYLVERLLGKGGFGAVYLARDREVVSRPVVIKILHEESLSNDWVVNKFRQEIEALARVDHPGIVGVFDAGTLMPDKIPFIVMQYVEGVTLRELIKQEGMDFERAANIIRQFSHALEEAHSKKVFHRDLKPENIMIRTLSTGVDQVKVIDFGIAKVRNSALGPSTITKWAVGTISYMSPEQLNAQPALAASDIYAMGIIAYEMLTGRRPFNFESVGQLLEMQKTTVKVMPVDLRPSIPTLAQAIILKAITYNSRERYQSARQFGDELADALTAEPQTEAAHHSNRQDTSDAEKKQTEDIKKETSSDIARDTDKQTTHDETPVGRRSRLIFAGAAVLVLIGLISVAAWFVSKQFSQPVDNSSLTETANERLLTYSLTVQKMNNKEPLGEPFQSTGEEIFASGWKFHFNFTPSDTGFLYVIDEGQNDKGEQTYFVLFPTPKNNNGSAKISANQKLETLWNIFDENQGKEKVWFIWTTKANADLEKITADASQNGFVVTDGSQIKILRQLCQADSTSKTKVEKDDKNSTVTIRGKNDPLVSFVELSHKPY